jgi:hypothetical protein
MINCNECELKDKEIEKLKGEISLLKEHIISLALEDSKEESEDDTEYMISDDEMLDLSSETLESIINEYYTEEFFLKGKEGVAEFIGKHIIKFKRRYNCTDMVRDIFTYIDIEEPYLIHKDVRCRKLMEKIYPFLSKKISSIYKSLIDEELEEGYDIGYDSEIDEIIASSVENEDDDFHSIFISIKNIKKDRDCIVNFLKDNLD